MDQNLEKKTEDEAPPAPVIKGPKIYKSDYSIYPNYDDFELPYDVICRVRYLNKLAKLNAEFREELRMMEEMQTSALAQLRFNRLFSATNIWPPLHTVREINYTLNRLYPMTPKQTKRLRQLMSSG